jgi:hypothetical protein
MADWFKMASFLGKNRLFYFPHDMLPNELREKKIRLSRGVAGGFWMKLEAQLAQPC